MSTWLMDLTKFINKEKYSDEIYVEAKNTIIETFTTSDTQTRNNMLSQIKMYQNTIANKINDPIYANKYKHMVDMVNILDSLNFNIEETKVEPEKVDLTENLNNVVTNPKRRGIPTYEEREQEEFGDDYINPENYYDENGRNDKPVPIEESGDFIDELINSQDKQPVEIDLNKIPDKIETDDFVFDITEGLTEEEIEIGKRNLETGNYVKPDISKLETSSNIKEAEVVDTSNYHEPQKHILNPEDKLLKIKFKSGTDKDIIAEYYDISMENAINGYLEESSYNKLVEIYNNYNIQETIELNPYLPKYIALSAASLDIEDREMLEDVKDVISSFDTNSKKYKRAAALIDELYETYINNPKVVEKTDSEMFTIKEEAKPKLQIENVSFDEILHKVFKPADIKILSSANGTRLEKLKKYRNSEINGRKIYLPDSNYEVTVTQVTDKSQISFMLGLMKEYGINMDEVEMFVKDEFIRILYNHCIFDFQTNVTYTDFIKNLSPNDLELLFVVFAIVNTKELVDGTLPLTVKYVQCTDCERTIGFKENDPMVFDLKSEFKNIYDVEKFINQYKVFKTVNYTSIAHAYVSGIYGTINKIIHTVGNTIYEVFVSKPTVYKQMMITANNEHIAYRTLGKNLDNKKRFLNHTMDNINDVINYINTHSYAQFKGDIDHINKNHWSLESDQTPEEEKPRIKIIAVILDMIEEVIEELKPVFFASLIIDSVHIKLDDQNSLTFGINDESDIYEYIELLKTELPDDLLVSIADKVNEIDYINKDVQITLTPEEIAAKSDFWSMYKKPDDLMKDMTANGIDTETIKNTIDAVEEKRVKFESDHRCPYCGGGLFKVDYNTLLFFFITNQLS